MLVKAMSKIIKLKAELDKKEPFTDIERSGNTKRDLTFIRHMQIVYHISKEEAFRRRSKRVDESKDALKKLGRTVRNRLKPYLAASPKAKSTITSFANKRTSVPKRTPHKKQVGSTNDKTKAYLANPNSQKDATYNRVLRQSKLHPGASKYELQHGINSVASKAYRARHQNA